MIVMVDLLEHDCEYSMRSGRGVVHLRRSSRSGSITQSHVLQNLSIIFHLHLCQVLHVWTFCW